MFIAKPFLNSDKAMKEFDDVDNAVAYLEKVTGFEMSFEVDRKKKKQLIKDGCLLLRPINCLKPTIGN